MTQQQDDQIVGWSMSRLTNAYDMGHWTSQHLTAGASRNRYSLSQVCYCQAETHYP
jgi:hypothetical protein